MLLDAAIALYRRMITFEEAGIARQGAGRRSE